MKKLVNDHPYWLCQPPKAYPNIASTYQINLELVQQTIRPEVYKISILY